MASTGPNTTPLPSSFIRPSLILSLTRSPTPRFVSLFLVASQLSVHTHTPFVPLIFPLSRLPRSALFFLFIPSTAPPCDCSLPPSVVAGPAPSIPSASRCGTTSAGSDRSFRAHVEAADGRGEEPKKPFSSERKRKSVKVFASESSSFTANRGSFPAVSVDLCSPSLPAPSVPSSPARLRRVRAAGDYITGPSPRSA